MARYAAPAYESHGKLHDLTLKLNQMERRDVWRFDLPCNFGFVPLEQVHESFLRGS